MWYCSHTPTSAAATAALSWSKGSRSPRATPAPLQPWLQLRRVPGSAEDNGTWVPSSSTCSWPVQDTEGREGEHGADAERRKLCATTLPDWAQHPMQLLPMGPGWIRVGVALGSLPLTPCHPGTVPVVSAGSEEKVLPLCAPAPCPALQCPQLAQRLQSHLTSFASWSEGHYDTPPLVNPGSSHGKCAILVNERASSQVS